MIETERWLKYNPKAEETSTRVVVMFVNTGTTWRRGVSITRSPKELPKQLAGRIELVVWESLWNELNTFAQRHPHVKKVPAAHNPITRGAVACLAQLFFQPNKDDYRPWLEELKGMLMRYRPVLQPAGITLKALFAEGEDYVVHLDVDAGVAVAQPVAQLPPPLPPGEAPPRAHVGITELPLPRHLRNSM